MNGKTQGSLGGFTMNVFVLYAARCSNVRVNQLTHEPHTYIHKPDVKGHKKKYIQFYGLTFCEHKFPVNRFRTIQARHLPI